MVGSWALPWVQDSSWLGSCWEAVEAPCLSFPTWEPGWGCDAGQVEPVVWRGWHHSGSIMLWEQGPSGAPRSSSDLGRWLGPQDVFSCEINIIKIVGGQGTHTNPPAMHIHIESLHLYIHIYLSLYIFVFCYQT